MFSYFSQVDFGKRWNHTTLYMDKKQIAKESMTIVLSGLLLAYPISVVVIYLCIDVIGMPSVFATSLNTFVLTVVAFIRVFFIRVYTEKHK